MRVVCLRCNACRELIRWPAGQPWPQYCPACGTDVSLPARADIQAPFLARPRAAQAVDGVYRAMEEGSEARAQAAADMLGVPAAETGDLKITNLHDSLRQGDVAAVELPANAVTQRMAEMSKQGLPTGFIPNGAEYGTQVQTGAFANAGAKMQQLIRSGHSSVVDPRQAGAVTSDMPALETLQPGYVRRA